MRLVCLVSNIRYLRDSSSRKSITKREFLRFITYGFCAGAMGRSEEYKIFLESQFQVVSIDEVVVLTLSKFLGIIDSSLASL